MLLYEDEHNIICTYKFIVINYTEKYLEVHIVYYCRKIYDKATTTKILSSLP